MMHTQLNLYNQTSSLPLPKAMYGTLSWARPTPSGCPCPPRSPPHHFLVFTLRASGNAGAKAIYGIKSDEFISERERDRKRGEERGGMSENGEEKSLESGREIERMHTIARTAASEAHLKMLRHSWVGTALPKSEQ